MDGEPVTFTNPRDARALGIATVFQDLATVPLMSVWRNFFLGNEPTKGRGPLQRLDIKAAQSIMQRRDVARWASTSATPTRPSGPCREVSVRRSRSRARCTSAPRCSSSTSPPAALGVRQSGIVLKYVVQARASGRGVIFITHNPHHAFPVGDRFVLLKRGQMMGSYLKSETSLDQLTSLMAGGAELEQLSHELQGLAADPELAEVAKELASEVKETA